MRIAILGTRGIPNNYGGFEQLAQYLSVELVNRGHQVWVYNSSLHPYKESTFHGVSIISCYDPESKIGTVGQFVYDFNCILDSRKRNFDIILQLGYTSNSVWYKLLPKKSVIMSNMDGMEWMRSKYGKNTQKFLKIAEKWAVKSSHVLVADSIAIQKYLFNKYKVKANYIPYGATIFNTPNPEVLNFYALTKQNYYLLIARFEPENNLEIIIQGYLQSEKKMPLVIVGNTANNFGQFLQSQYRHPNIKFVGPIYDLDVLNNLRYFCALYFHGHSVGGTNPSLLEAMASYAPICAHNNEFNKEVLGQDAIYFKDPTDVMNGLNQEFPFKDAVSANIKKIERKFSWPLIINGYELLMKESLTF
jgi:glycosyltransferase involved in cell wall biosynthesis